MTTQTAASAAPKTAPPSVAGGLLQRKCACGGSSGLSGECDECQKKRLQRHSRMPAAPTEAPPVVHDVLRSPGQPLDANTRTFFEGRFTHDFNDVRVHSDRTAAESARAVNAQAYTVGRDIVFAAGEYQPLQYDGRQLIAHELAHVMQQRGAAGAGSGGRLVVDGNRAAEREAEEAARGIAHDHGLIHVGRSAGRGVARQEAQKRDPVEEDILNDLAAAHLASAATTIRPDHVLWKKLDPLWMAGMLKLLERAQQLGYLHVLDEGVDGAAGIFRERLRLAIDAVKMKASRGAVSSIDERFEKRLEILPQQQRGEIITYLTGGAKVVGITATPRPGQVRPEGLEDWKARQQAKPAAAATGRSVAAMSTAEKMGKAAEYGAEQFGGKVGEKLLALLTPEAIATMAAFLTAYIVSQATPAGWVADVIGGGLLVVSVIMIGSEVIDAVTELIAFGELATNAKSDADLKEAGGHLANALAIVGVDVVIAILFKKAGNAAAKPYLRPPPPAELRAFEITAKGPKPVPAERFAANDNAFPNNENLRSNVIDLSSRRPSARQCSGPTCGTSALKIQPDIQPDVTPDVQPKPAPDPAPLPDPAAKKGGTLPKAGQSVAPGGAAAAAQQAAKKKKERPECDRAWVPRGGGEPYANFHNEFAAAMVSRFKLPASPEMDYSVSKGGAESTDYDSYDARSQDLYEFKTRHRYLPYEQLTITWLRSAGLAAQAADQHNTRVVCGIKGKLIWIFDRQEVANAARTLLLQCGVDIVQAEPGP